MRFACRQVLSETVGDDASASRQLRTRWFCADLAVSRAVRGLYVLKRQAPTTLYQLKIYHINQNRAQTLAVPVWGRWHEVPEGVLPDYAPNLILCTMLVSSPSCTSFALYAEISIYLAKIATLCYNNSVR